jgi:hypothetical protein
MQNTKQLIKKNGFKFEWENLNSENTKQQDGFWEMRGWQIQAFDCLKSEPFMILNAPMGSGKSWLMCLLSAFKLKQDKSLRCIISVPQTIIASGFCDAKIHMPDGEKLHWQIKHNLCKDKPSKSTINYFIRWLTQPISNFSDRTIICTHATLVGVYKKLKQENRLDLLHNTLLWIDEAHHVKNIEIEGLEGAVINNGIGELASYFLSNVSQNNQIGLTTASYARGDRATLLTNAMESKCKRFNLPYDAYLQTMKHLKSFSFDFLICGPNYIKGIEQVILSQKCKDIIYIPHPVSQFSTGDKHKEVSDIINIYGNESHTTNDGLTIVLNDQKEQKILNLVSEAQRSQKKAFLDNPIIKENRDALDTIIALGMFKEGANWIHANRSIIVGVRSSLVDVIQMIGRLFRDAEGKEHVNVIQLLPFSLEQLDEDNFSENLNDYLKTILALLILENIFNPIKIKPMQKALKNESEYEFKNAKTNWLELALPDVSKQLSLVEDLSNNLLDIMATNNEMANDVNLIYEEYQKISPPLLEKHGIKEHKEEIAQQIWGEWTRRTMQMQGLSVEDIDFNIIQKEVNPLGFLLKYTSGACDISTFEKLRKAIQLSRTPLTKDLIIDWVHQHISKYNKKPRMLSGKIEFASGPYKGITWSAVNSALWKGGRGLVGGSSLANLIAEEFGIKNKMNLPPLTEKIICDWVGKFIEKNKRKPTKSDGIIEFANNEYKGETWKTINFSLLRGTRGLRGGSSLAKLIQQKFGIRDYCNPPKLSLEMIREWIQKYIIKHNTKPTAKSGIVEFAEDEYKGITWAAIADAMSNGRRGLTGKLSLAQYIEDEFKISNHCACKPLTDVVICDWIKKFIDKYKRKPTQNDEIIEFAGTEYNDIRWNTLNTMLWGGGRSLPGGSSLAQFINTHFGIQNRNFPSILNSKLVYTWIEAYITKFGEKPTKTSGIVEFAEGEHKGITWSTIDCTFKRGKRGLPKSTLAQFIQNEFEIRSAGNSTLLTEELILKWANQYIIEHGNKPTAKSGVVKFAVGDHKNITWLAVDASLRKGRHGLPGKTSLANLIHEKIGIKNHLKN